MAARRLQLQLLLLSVSCIGSIQFIYSAIDPGDGAVLRSLKDQWENTPRSWDKSADPCGSWDGISCTNSRVTAIGLSTMGLKGTLSSDIAGLTELRSLDLSFNRGLTGTLTPRLGDLQNLNILILAGCGFSGRIPDEIGRLSELSFLALNSNNLTGNVPTSFGNLSKIYWLDVADNQLSGPIPVSNSTSPGLDQLIHCKHFHFNKNKLTGSLPVELFNSEMILIHVLFDNNQLSGTIPSSLGLVKTLEVVRLDRNHFSGQVPSNLNNLTNVNELHLAQNKLTGPFPDLTGMRVLSYVDLSNNSFDETDVPEWFTTIDTLTTLIIENGLLQGPLPDTLFSFQNLQQVKLKNNSLNGTLSMGNKISQQLQLVDLQSNDIDSVTIGASYSNALILIDNPICNTNSLSNTNYCLLEQAPKAPYSTSLANCGEKSCPENQKLIPQSCECAYPYAGTFYFRGPSFRELSNANLFHALEMGLWKKFDLTPGSVSLQNIFFNDDDYLQVHADLFPSPPEKHFNTSMIQKIGFFLSNQTFKPPNPFGPYYFIASPYIFPEANGGTKLSLGVIIGIVIGGSVLLLVLLGVALYAVLQKKRAERAIGLSRPFASWAGSGKDSGGAPQLKGARFFSYDELKKCTSNFSNSNEIGSGGYGKVYRGLLQDGQLVAIKRAQRGSMQGGLEFKTEIELLSRVHHKNLVGLLGFCFEQEEQMLVYEYMPNGSVRDSLSGKSGIPLDWKRRLRVALGSARGLTYLHELANPSIIHRDIKSTNILLDENLNAKVADFGLCKLVSDSGKGHISTQVKGTLGYLDPEYYLTQQLTEKSDVYSYGVLLLELLTSKQPIEKGKYVVREVKTHINKQDTNFFGLKDMLDPMIKSAPTGASLSAFSKYIELSLRCVEETASDRPAMSEIVKVIEGILQSEGMNTNSTTSAASSVTDFGTKVGSHNPYDVLGKNYKEGGGSDQSGAFDYSGNYTLSTEVEPK